MNLKRWSSVILMAGLVVALSAPSALAWNNRPFGGHHSKFRGGAPHGRAYGWHGQRPAWNHGNAYGWHHRNQWHQRNQWNQRTPYGPYHRGSWGQQGYGQSHTPNLGRSYGPHTPYSNAAYRFGPHH
jgi:hypothetical protein